MASPETLWERTLCATATLGCIAPSACRAQGALPQGILALVSSCGSALVRDCAGEAQPAAH